MSQRISRAQVLREAEELLSLEHQAAEAPRVLWAGLNESPEAFALRCARLQNSGAFRILAAIPHGWSVPDGVQAVEFPPKHFKLLHPSVKTRYRTMGGGRGSAKSHSFATAIVLRLMEARLRVLCAREIQRSLRESVHHLLSAKIEKLKLDSYFDITDREIVCTLTRGEIIFGGLANNPQQLRSLEGINIVWVEEGESVSAESFQILVPTIRETDSEIWISFNPDDEKAPVQAYVDSPRSDVRHLHVTFEDNPWFPAELDAERIYLQSVDPDAYAHIWLGHTRSYSAAQVFAGKYAIEEFTPDPEAFEPGGVTNPYTLNQLYSLGRLKPQHVPKRLWNGPYVGCDWGFSNDPSTLVKCWVSRRVLYVEYEAYGLGVDIDRTPALFDTVPDARRHVIRADCSRPETISYMRANGYSKIEACAKWSGCVEDGIAFIRSFERVVIHPRCTHTAEEFRLYSFKVDRLSGDVRPEPEDKHNHCVDALRYSLEPLIRNRGKATITPFPWV